jgi:hypothetical protein
VTTLQLTRSTDDQRLYALEDLGTLRLDSPDGQRSRLATAAAGDRRWHLAHVGPFMNTIHAVDTSGAVVGRYDDAGLRDGGALRWSRRALALRCASRWKDRYALLDGDVEIAMIWARTWGLRPARVVGDELTALDPGLLLFATFVVRVLAEDSASAAGGSP